MFGVGGGVRELKGGTEVKLRRVGGWYERIAVTDRLRRTFQLFQGQKRVCFLKKIFSDIDEKQIWLEKNNDWHWGYEGVYGPECWGLHHAACNGRKQSPIDIKYAGVSPTSEPTGPPGTALEMTGYENTTNGIFKNNGHTAVRRLGCFQSYNIYIICIMMTNFQL